VKPILTALLFAAVALPAGDPAGFNVWKSAELKEFNKSLSPKIDAKKVATQPIPGFGNYSFIVAHREGSGEAEYHDTQADIFVVQTGEATLVYGGKMVDAKTTAPNEMRGPRCGQHSSQDAAPVETRRRQTVHLFRGQDHPIKRGWLAQGVPIILY
jgi:hypothetical protein